MERWAVANKIHAPSYISLQTALSYYGFIPEGVFHITSVTNRNTANFELDSMRYSYHNIKFSWFFGYQVLEQDEIAVRMATPEKTILDLLYLNPQFKNPQDFEALRLDRVGIRAAIQPELWADFVTLATKKTLHTRAKTFQNWLHDRA